MADKLFFVTVSYSAGLNHFVRTHLNTVVSIDTEKLCTDVFGETMRVRDSIFSRAGSESEAQVAQSQDKTPVEMPYCYNFTIDFMYPLTE